MQVRTIERVCEIPHEGPFCDLMWSDPEDMDTWAVSPRGAGWLFGSRVTAEFNHINGLELICRAHQLVQEGLKYMFEGETLSCSECCCSGALVHMLPILMSTDSRTSEALLGKFVIHLRSLRGDFSGGADQSLVTVWSAPNYCYRCGNVASILAFDDSLDRQVKYFTETEENTTMMPPRNAVPYFL